MLDTWQPAPDSKASVPVTFFVIVLVQLVATAGLVTIYSMIISLRREYAGQGLDMGWAITSYLFVAAAAAVVCGRLGDVYNRKVVVLAMLGIALVGALISIVAPSPLGVLTGCALQGIAGALTPVGIGLARDNLPARHMPLALGAISATGNAGAGLIFFGAGWITDHYASHGAFVMKLVMAAAAVAAVALFIPSRSTPPEIAEQARRIRFARGVAFCVPLAALLISINRVLVWGAADPRTLGLSMFALLGLGWWLRDQHRQQSPLVDVGMLRNRRLALAVLAHFMLGIGSVQYGQVYSIFLQEPQWTGGGLGLTAATAGLTLAMLNASTCFSGLLAGKVIGSRGARWTALLGTSIIIVGAALLLARHDTHLSVAILGMLVVNGITTVLTAHYALFVEESPEGRTGETAAMGFVAFTIAMSLGSQIVLALYDSSTVPDPVIAGLRHPDGVAFFRVLTYMLVAGTAMLAIQALLPRRPALATSPQPA